MYKIGISISLMFAIAFACQPAREPHHAEEPDPHEGEALQSTLFTDSTEFFIEYGPLVAGKESEFLIHVTELRTYKPYRSGTLTIDLDGVSVLTDEPESPGIFHVVFTPARTGEFEVAYSFSFNGKHDMAVDHVDVSAGEPGSSQGDHAGDLHEHEGEPEKGEIQLLKEQAWANNFRVEMVSLSPFSSVIQASGEIQAMPGEKKNLAATSSGIIIFNEKNLVQGSAVKKGQKLFTLSSKSFIGDNVERQYQEYLNNLRRSESEYERYTKLYASNVISEKKYIESRTTYLTDSIRFYNLAAKATQDGLIVYSPVSGYIHELNVSEGQYVEQGQLLVTISSNKILLLRADIPQQFYYQLADIETANFRLAYSDRTYSVEELNGHLLARGSSVAENNHYLPVYFEVENDGSLLEGAFAEFYLLTSGKPGKIVIPLSAISEELGTHYVYLQVSGETYTKRTVSTGQNDGRYVEIMEGLEPGDRIVTKGAMLLKATSMVTVEAGDGHAH